MSQTISEILSRFGDQPEWDWDSDSCFTEDFSKSASVGIRAVGALRLGWILANLAKSLGKPVVEFGSGMGLIGGITAVYGVEVNCYDPAPFREYDEDEDRPHLLHPTREYTLQDEDDDEIKRLQNCVLAIIWPDASSRRNRGCQDLEAIRILHPCAIVAVTESMGGSGSEYLLEFLNPEGDAPEGCRETSEGCREAPESFKKEYVQLQTITKTYGKSGCRIFVVLQVLVLKESVELAKEGGVLSFFPRGERPNPVMG